jgi:hypothetical protein
MSAMRLGYVSAMRLDYVVAHAVRVTPVYAVRATRLPVRSGPVKLSLLTSCRRTWFALADAFSAQVDGLRWPFDGRSAAGLAAIGRKLLTSAIMKSHAQFRYTEYPDMFG